MYSPDSSDILFPASGSRLLSESPVLHSSSSHTSPNGDDLSISELSLSDRTVIIEKPFSLLARSEQEPSTPTRSLSEHIGGEEDNANTNDAGGAEKEERRAAQLHEEKLQSDKFILKKLNASFALFHEALQGVGSANMRVAAQLEQTDALLNRYIGILSKSEDFARLIFDEQWQGADEDEQILEQERMEEEQKARREAEERAFAAQQELERQEREEKERIEREERERKERERKERTASRGGGVRGVRGTRASMRGMRGTVRIATAGIASNREQLPGTNNVQTKPPAIPSKRSTSSASGVRSSTTGSVYRSGLSRRT